MKLRENGNATGYVFWPAETVDALFSKKVSPEDFRKKMQKLYKISVTTEIDPDSALAEAAKSLLEGLL